MNSRIRLFSIVTLLGVALTATGILAYERKIDAVIHSFELDAKNAQITGALFQKEQLEAKVDEVQKNLTDKEAEIAKKEQEVEAANKELAAKLKDLESAQKKIKAQESQIAANSTELSKLRDRPPLFSFKVESTSLSDADAKKEAVKQVVTDAYDVIQDIYGKPYLLHEVLITFVDSFSNPNAGAETVISNSADGLSLTIKLKDFDKNSFNDVNAIIHELLHSFHGLSTLSPIAYEEGITVAAADAVMEKLIADGKIPSFKPLYIRLSDSGYDSAKPLPASDSAFYYSDDVTDYYQTAGYGWYQIYKSDKSFFKTFNEKVYSKKRDGIEITEALVRQLIKESYSGTVRGQSMDNWLQTKAFLLR